MNWYILMTFRINIDYILVGVHILLDIFVLLGKDHYTNLVSFNYKCKSIEFIGKHSIMCEM